MRPTGLICYQLFYASTESRFTGLEPIESLSTGVSGIDQHQTKSGVLRLALNPDRHPVKPPMEAGFHRRTLATGVRTPAFQIFGHHSLALMRQGEIAQLAADLMRLVIRQPCYRGAFVCAPSSRSAVSGDVPGLHPLPEQASDVDSDLT